jgi:hypothetical protein
MDLQYIRENTVHVLNLIINVSIFIASLLLVIRERNSVVDSLPNKKQ